MECAVYRHFDAHGVLLYVGSSTTPEHRNAVHRSRAHWANSIDRIDVEWFDTIAKAQSIERLAIINERPKHNINDAGETVTGSAKALKLLRADLQMTQSQLADTIGVKRSCLSNWESGKQWLSIDGAMAIRREFCVSLDDLFPEGCRDEATS